MVLQVALVLDVHLHRAGGWVGLQSGRHADKPLHKYINFLECVCVVNIIVQPKVTDHTSMYHQCQQKHLKMPFLVLSVHAPCMFSLHDRFFYC